MIPIHRVAAAQLQIWKVCLITDTTPGRMVHPPQSRTFHQMMRIHFSTRDGCQWLESLAASCEGQLVIYRYSLFFSVSKKPVCRVRERAILLLWTRRRGFRPHSRSDASDQRLSFCWQQATKRPSSCCAQLRAKSYG